MAVERKGPDELQEHMLWTYYGLRVGLAAIGFALPLVLVLLGALLHDEWLKPSISEFYYVKGTSFLTTRDVFVAGLFAAGICLYLYKGFSNKENVALNAAGLFAALVATFPTAETDDKRGVVSAIHGASAVLFFLSIAYVSVFRSSDTLRLLSEARRPRYRRAYMITSLAMIVSPFTALALSFFLRPADARIFLVETLGVWAFSAYWVVKTLEMRDSSAEKLALDAELRRELVPDPDGREGPPTSGAAEKIVRK